ncbi:VCBS repeat-containing protein [Maribacter sp. LLG6340-A2]|uniref:VCBS repeat-containing protein n=1 Tax=Maribacter sp. LLG6340-A2 TaxID=3160834 RepID=UPI003865C367
MTRYYFLYVLIMVASLTGCKDKTLFSKIPGSDSGLIFENRLVEDEEHNVMTYEYIYNGGGVAVADFNNDGLSDVYLSGNSVPNKLFLNQGNLKFKDITAISDLTEKKGWKTGVTIVDINGDGWMDIYLCYSGNAPQEGFEKPVIIDYAPRANQLFVNTGKLENGVPKFIDKTDEYNVGAIGTFSTQAYFFDYDLDGDLDLFLLNHANKFYSTFYNVKKVRTERHPYFGNKLYQNNDNTFVEVSEDSGIHGGGINFGLSAAISDLNLDGWPDIFVTNDYDEQDYCYLNNQDGTFREVSKTAFEHISKYSMGSDIADINNDGLPDIFVADMLPEDNYRQKVLKGPDEYNKYKMAIDSGYHHQHMRNMLQVNKGLNPDSILRFSEIGQFSGISNTDWSWAPLLADYDNDGLKDLFITNGYLRDYSNLDFVNFTANTAIAEAKQNKREISLMPLLNKMPSSKIANYAYRNIDGQQFKKVSQEWGLDEKSVSNAAAYADFDNDGDLDLLVSDLNAPVKLYKNNERDRNQNNYIKIKLKGEGKNSLALGSKVLIYLPDGEQVYQEVYYSRGYQSSVEPILTIGIGENKSIDKIEVYWPGGGMSQMTGVKINSVVTFDQAGSISGNYVSKQKRGANLKEVTQDSGITFRHKENDYVDFYYERLAPYQMSRLGGKMAVGDINGDGNDDVYFGGASGQSGALFLGKDNASYVKDSLIQPWSQLKPSEREEVYPYFFDVDNDGDLDLYSVSGGNEHMVGNPYYQDQLYINDGNGQFSNASSALPNTSFSGGVVKAADYDGDGDLDLFLGGRLDAQNYPFTPESIILQNNTVNNVIKFKKVVLDEIHRIGMVTDAEWVDLDKDGWLDLVLVGEWMPISIFKNNKGSLKKLEKANELNNTSGWWNRITATDIDNDGDQDLLLGNLGLNSQWKATVEEPMVFYVQDIDKDGNMDPLLTQYINGESYPLASRDELLSQVNSLKKTYTTWDKYANATIADVLKESGISATSTLTINELSSGYLMNNGGDRYEFHPLPKKVQQSIVNGFVVENLDNKGADEILIAGNFYPFRANMGKLDASSGQLLTWENDEFTVADVKIWLEGDVRDLKLANFKNGQKRIIVSRNDDASSVFEYKNKD